MLQIVDSFIHLHQYYLLITHVTTTIIFSCIYMEEETPKLLDNNHNNAVTRCSLKFCFRTFHFPTVKYELNETEVVTYKCCDGWKQAQNDIGCTQREFRLIVIVI